jgi:hypothetical protein
MTAQNANAESPIRVSLEPDSKARVPRRPERRKALAEMTSTDDGMQIDERDGQQSKAES